MTKPRLAGKHQEQAAEHSFTRILGSIESGCGARGSDGAEKVQNRLLTRHPSGVLRVDVSQCTTSNRLRVCCWRAAQ